MKYSLIAGNEIASARTKHKTLDEAFEEALKQSRLGKFCVIQKLETNTLVCTLPPNYLNTALVPKKQEAA